MVNLRLLTAILLLVQLAVVIPIAYNLIRIKRNPLDVRNRLPNIQAHIEHLTSQPCDSTRQFACGEAAGHDVWEWSPTLVFNVKLLVEETDAPLEIWSRIVRNISNFVKPLAQDFNLPSVVESSVIFYANAELLKRHSIGKSSVITADAVRKSIQQILDEAEVGGPGEHDGREINLVAWVQSGDKPINSEYIAYRIPGWGIVSFAQPLEASLGVFEAYAREVVFRLNNRKRDEKDIGLARRRALSRGLVSVLTKLNATKLLAEDLPRLPVPSSVSKPFEEAIDSLERALGSDNHALVALGHVRRASVLANGISSDPSLIPELYVSDENMFAIFAPLVFPTLLPLLMGFINELKVWLKRSRGRIAWL